VLHAAAHYLATLDGVPPCRMDVVAMDAGRIDWLPGAFDLTSADGNSGAGAAS
jgi:putative endonuclease